jgi:hypothetical protein
MLHDEGPDPVQLSVLRAMTPAERWNAANQLYWSARRWKAAYLRREHPEWSDGQVEDAVRSAFLYARS